MAQEKVKIPPFTPTEYEVKDRTYGNTGGHCMVGTLRVYLPEIDKVVWVNCNDEGASIDAGDTIWDSENDGSTNNAYDLNIYYAGFTDRIPEDIDQWLPIIKEALNYTIEQEIAYCGSFTLPATWIPDDICEKLGEDYLNDLKKKGESVCIGKGGAIVVED